jgi:GT2 family glycosyltransferase
MRIHAVTVNHNTSAYTELMLRSLHKHETRIDAIAVLDNQSHDDGLPALQTYCAQTGIAITQTGLGIDSANNSHGQVLRAWVLANPGPDHYLFLDTDVVFTHDDTVGQMLRALARGDEVWGVGTTPSWDGDAPVPDEVRTGNPDIADARLHPCCAPVPNTALFRHIFDVIGPMCYKRLWADHEEYLDTFELLTQVMLTHGKRHVLSPAMVRHFFAVSYTWEGDTYKAAHAQTRDALLAGLRG